MRAAAVRAAVTAAMRAAVAAVRAAVAIRAAAFCLSSRLISSLAAGALANRAAASTAHSPLLLARPPPRRPSPRTLDRRPTTAAFGTAATTTTTTTVSPSRSARSLYGEQMGAWADSVGVTLDAVIAPGNEDQKTMENCMYMLDELKRIDPLRRSEPVRAPLGWSMGSPPRAAPSLCVVNRARDLSIARSTAPRRARRAPLRGVVGASGEGGGPAPTSHLS